MKRATNVGREQLVHLGSCVGKLTHSGKFRLTIGALDVLAQFAKHKVRSGGCVVGVVCVRCVCVCRVCVRVVCLCARV